MSNSLTPWLTVAALILAVGLLSGWLLWNRRSIRGQIRRMLKQLGGVYLKDVVVPDGIDGEIQIDYLLRLPDRILVIDLKEMRGVLFGAEKIDEWTQIVERRSYRFPNPLHANRLRCQAISELVRPAAVAGWVVFTEASQFPRGRPDGVSTVSTLAEDLGIDASSSVAPEVEEGWNKLMRLASPLKS
ncbi:MAG: hypothetical protein Kow006_07360 [Gammaproteobacteria bacterium]